MNEIRISLDQQDFDKLVSGDIVTKNVNDTIVKIALQDIGYILMMDIIEEKFKNLNKNGK